MGYVVGIANILILQTVSSQLPKSYLPIYLACCYLHVIIEVGMVESKVCPPWITYVRLLTSIIVLVSLLQSYFGM